VNVAQGVVFKMCARRSAVKITGFDVVLCVHHLKRVGPVLLVRAPFLHSSCVVTPGRVEAAAGGAFISIAAG
jgi:hypothetical protein